METFWIQELIRCGCVKENEGEERERKLLVFGEVEKNYCAKISELKLIFNVNRLRMFLLMRKTGKLVLQNQSLKCKGTKPYPSFWHPPTSKSFRSQISMYE